MLVRRLITSEEAMMMLGKKLSKLLQAPLYIALNGPLGAGKTTLVRAILRGLGYGGIVRSPTYSLLESYELPFLKVFHLDLYRIADPQELSFIGIEEIFQLNVICLIEWPEKGEGYLPLPDLNFKLKIKGNAREIIFEGLTPKGQEELKAIKASGYGQA